MLTRLRSKLLWKKFVRIVLDSNVFVSALISKSGAPHRLYESWLQEEFVLVTSIAQLYELEAVLRHERMRK